MLIKCFAGAAVGLAVTAGAAFGQAAKPDAITAEGVPPIPTGLAEALRPYDEARSAVGIDWNPRDRSLLITTRFANTPQLHTVAMPMGARRQITFEADRVTDGVWSPTGDVLVVQKDVGGSEFYQLYTLAAGRLTLITDGKSRNEFGAFSSDGRWVGYTSTRRDGADSDLYVVDPRDPKTDHLVAKVSGGGWSFDAFTPDGRRALVTNNISVSRSVVYSLDLATGALTPLTDETAEVSWQHPKVAPDGTIWIVSDKDSDTPRLGVLDPRTGLFRPMNAPTKGEVEGFDLARDGSFAAYWVNQAGANQLHMLDTRSGQDRPVPALPYGVIREAHIAPWGAVAVSVVSPRIPGDVFVVDPKTLAAVRWTQSETGGLDPDRNPEAELVTIKSFDGEGITGFLYRPDPVRFPGPRPLIFDIHGGPEGQSQPVYNAGLRGYLLDELGVALFFPNVRGSTGFGKRFVNLDNGPFKREDTIKDIGAFLDHFANEPGVDAKRIAITGGSYGGYMTLGTLTHYSDRVRAAIEIVGISNFVTFLEHTQAYRRDLRRVEYGDERDPAQRAKLMDISPLTHADRIGVPLMVVTGGNDPRVPPTEADQIIKAVRAHGQTVWSLLAANEGHGYGRKENRDYTDLVELMFWRTYLLGDNAAK
jgi:dipeptidyl aminopeptidase/acylaminoacyl peptidase